MNDDLQPVDTTLSTIEKLFPPEKEPTKFDKVIDLIKATSSGTPWSVLGQAIETTGKVLNTITAGKMGHIYLLRRICFFLYFYAFLKVLTN